LGYLTEVLVLDGGGLATQPAVIEKDYVLGWLLWGRHLPEEMLTRLPGTRRLIEPYSLRRSRDGNLLLAAIKTATGEVRTYRLDRIESVEVSTRPFRPRYAIEFAAVGPTPARLVNSGVRTGVAHHAPQRP
jgi:hypothetical protein